MHALLKKKIFIEMQSLISAANHNLYYIRLKYGLIDTDFSCPNNLLL